MTTDTRARGEVQEIIDQMTSGGHVARFAVREDTNDSALVRGIIGGSEYPFDRLANLTGWALDIGAHIGIVTVALALDNPTLHIVAVEALAENCEMLRRNLRINRIEDRVEVVEAAAGNDGPTEILYGYESVPGEPDGYVRASRFIGNIYSARPEMVVRSRTVRGMSLGTILDSHEIHTASLVKIDIEGAEWALLEDPSVRRVDRFIGEWHGDPGLPGLRRLLRTHTVTQLDQNPVNGIFEAVRR